MSNHNEIRRRKFNGKIVEMKNIFYNNFYMLVYKMFSYYNLIHIGMLLVYETS